MASPRMPAMQLQALWAALVVHKWAVQRLKTRLVKDRFPNDASNAVPGSPGCTRRPRVSCPKAQD
eukprot:gene8828-70_t